MGWGRTLRDPPGIRSLDPPLKLLTHKSIKRYIALFFLPALDKRSCASFFIDESAKPAPNDLECLYCNVLSSHIANLQDFQSYIHKGWLFLTINSIWPNVSSITSLPITSFQHHCSSVATRRFLPTCQQNKCLLSYKCIPTWSALFVSGLSSKCNAIATLFDCSSCTKKDFANQQAQEIRVR